MVYTVVWIEFGTLTDPEQNFTGPGNFGRRKDIEITENKVLGVQTPIQNVIGVYCVH
jgi:hypothetical protein